MEFAFQTKGELDLVDITREMKDFVREKDVEEGVLVLFLPHATAGLITLENESGLVEDMKDCLRELIPKGAGYEHDRIDNNAHSHLRASVLSPDLVIPIVKGELELGAWQQIFMVDADNRPRSRRLIARIIE